MRLFPRRRPVEPTVRRDVEQLLDRSLDELDEAVDELQNYLDGRRAPKR